MVIRALGEGAGMISHLLAKNPSNEYDREEKGARVRLVYTKCTEEETEVVLYATPDPIELVKGSPDNYDITQYINDREFAVSSLFCSYIRSALGTALNGKPKEAYLPWVGHPFQLELSFGPVASNLPDGIVEQLFTALGYELRVERGELPYSFELKSRSTARYLTFSGQQTLQNALRQLFVLIPVLDDYKHYFIGEDELDKIRRYGEGWLEDHPLRDLILKRTLRFGDLIGRYNEEVAGTVGSVGTEKEAGVSADVEPEADLAPEDEESTAAPAAADDGEQDAPQPKIRLNELRYQAIIETVEALADKTSIVDFGSGEGKLAAKLGWIDGVERVLAVEPSAVAQLRAIDRFAKMEGRQGAAVPTPVSGSLFYFDESLRGHNVMILCEVIEHIDEHRLARVMDTIVHEYRPEVLIVTTPNKEYNRVYEMEDEAMRHNDHRFEWTREEFRDWCDSWASDRYTVDWKGIGEEAEGFGQPTQMAVCTLRKEANRW
ncbi:methyltransferase domain-containing protein [Paenibacillus oceani]|nr:methyltransferase domain-containing protein [Paenibacillus oceani]